MLPSTEIKRVFIYTGNITNVAVLPVPLLLNGGMGKAASAYWLGVADGAYAAKGYRSVPFSNRNCWFFLPVYKSLIRRCVNFADSSMPISDRPMVKSPGRQ